VIKGLPLSKLQVVLDAFKIGSSSGLDIQIKVLQALPAFSENYSEQLKDDLLASALHICAVLQNVKTPTVSAIAIATLQQLIVLVFDKVAGEDEAAKKSKIAPIAQVQVNGQSIGVREAAHDAYRILLDLAQATDGRNTDFFDISSLSVNLGLELIHVALTNSAISYSSHPEFAQVIKINLLPLLIRLLSERQSFGTTLRVMRITPIIIQRHTRQMSEECEMLLGLFNHLLDPNSSSDWKRIMVMEVYKKIYATPSLVINLCLQYDQKSGTKHIIHDNISIFVRLSGERPASLGIGQSQPLKKQSRNDIGAFDAAAIEAGAGITDFATDEIPAEDLDDDTAWLMPKTALLDVLDKNEAPPLPDGYIYGLVLDCLSSLSDNLARVILPLTLSTNRKRLSDNGSLSTKAHATNYTSMPINPLKLVNSPSAEKVKAIASLLEDSWTALLATCATFLAADISNELYRNVIRSIQKFAQVSGLLELSTSRDAFLTALSKGAITPNLISSLSIAISSKTGEDDDNAETSTIITQRSSISSQRPITTKQVQCPLTTRNLLCLRALINIAIALGPTLGQASTIILRTIEQIDLFVYLMKQNDRGMSISSLIADVRQSYNDVPLALLAGDIDAANTASKRFLESTSEFPEEAFYTFIEKFCQSLSMTNCFINAVDSASPHMGADQYVILTKFATLIELNTLRFATVTPSKSGWGIAAECLINIATSRDTLLDSRLLAAETISNAVIALVNVCATNSDLSRENVQTLALATIHELGQQTVASAEKDIWTNIDLSAYGYVLGTIKTILENSGESLVVGWNYLLSCVQNVFTNSTLHQNTPQDAETAVKGPLTRKHSEISTEHVQFLLPDLGRIAFAIVQNICSEYLNNLPVPFFPDLCRLLSQFILQHTTLNISLTTTTLFSDVSAFLTTNDAISDLAELSKSIDIFQDQDPETSSRAGQWILLLRELSNVTTDDRPEIRKGSFQILSRIAFSQQITDASALEYVFVTVFLNALSKNVKLQRINKDDYDDTVKVMDTASKAFIDSAASYLGNNLQTFEQCAHFEQIWERFMNIVRDYLLVKSHIISEAIYLALSNMLALVSQRVSPWSEAVARVMMIWTSNIPENDSRGEQMEEQNAFFAYVECGSQLVRLMNLDQKQITEVADNITACVAKSTPDRYGNDATNMTDLQSRSLLVLQQISLDDPVFCSKMLKTASYMAELPFVFHQGSHPTFVAYSKSAIDWIVRIVEVNSEMEELFTADVTNAVMKSLLRPMQLKYSWKINGKDPAPWKKSSLACQIVVPTIIKHIQNSKHSIEIDEIWKNISLIITSIIHADYSVLSIPESYADVCMVEQDEQFDASAFLSLRSSLIPALGSDTACYEARKEYCSALFSASIIHPLYPSESLLLSNPIKHLFDMRQPTIDRPEASRREDLAYLCFAELITMVSARPTEIKWNATSAFMKPFSPGDYRTEKSSTGRNLPEAAFPWLLARFAATLKSYIIDQPFRAPLPTPIAMVEELLWMLDRMAELECVDDLIPSLAGKNGIEGNVSERANKLHLIVLKPLIVKAVGVAGDKLHGNDIILKSLMRIIDGSPSTSDDICQYLSQE